MDADAAHAVVESLTLAVEHAFDAEGRKLVGNHSEVPMPIAVFRIGKNFGRGVGFMPAAEGATSVKLR